VKIEQRAVETLIPYINNSRKHSDEQVAQIAASIKEFGWTNPILVDGANGLIAGHGRLLAARKLGMAKVPVIELAHLSENQKKALIIADNKLALNSDWDNNLLMIELQELNNEDYDLSVLGFNQDELDALLNPIEPTTGLTDEDAVPDVPDEPKTKPGDIYILGNHRLMCGDSTSIDDVEKLMDGEIADFMFTSPPYNAGDSEKLSGNTHTDDNKYATYRDDKSSDEYLDLLCGFTNAWMTCTKVMAINLQQLAGNKIAFIEYLYHYKNNFIDMAIWNKGHGAPAMAKNVMNSAFEYVIFLSKEQNPSRAFEISDFRGTVKNVYDAPPNRNNEFSSVHAATFPIHLPEWGITTFTKNKTIIADCFGGTGTTLIVCEKHNRKARLMELDPKYCDVIVKRWEEFTGKKAKLSELEKV
jgi:DNA modification methylase